MTTSCTHALEMATDLIELKEGDEVIMPSFTFPSTANAVINRGARIVLFLIVLQMFQKIEILIIIFFI